MVQRISFWLLLISLASIPLLRADLDLTPDTTTRRLDDASFPQLIFTDGPQRVSYESPRGWSYSAVSPMEIRFNPPQMAQAQATIEAIPLPEKSNLDDKSIKKLRDDIIKALPKNSTQVEVVSEVTDSLMINGRKTYEITIAYMCYGQRYRTSVLFANLDRQQLRCRVLTRAPDFDQVHRDFSASLCSLQWLKNGS